MGWDCGSAGIGSGCDAPGSVVGSARRGGGSARMPPPRVRPRASQADRRRVSSGGGRQDGGAGDGGGRRRSTTRGAELSAVMARRSITRSLAADSHFSTALAIARVVPPSPTLAAPVPTRGVSDARTETRLPSPLPPRRHPAPPPFRQRASQSDRQPRTVLISSHAQVCHGQHPEELQKSRPASAIAAFRLRRTAFTSFLPRTRASQLDSGRCHGCLQTTRQQSYILAGTHWAVTSGTKGDRRGRVASSTQKEHKQKATNLPDCLQSCAPRLMRCWCEGGGRVLS